MTYQKFNAFCRALPATGYVMQWGGSHVWKIGGKVFAVGGWAEGAPAAAAQVISASYLRHRRHPRTP